MEEDFLQAVRSTMSRETKLMGEKLGRRIAAGEVSRERGREFLTHLDRIDAEIFSHEVIRNNPYTKWFREGTASVEQVRDLIVQFSVFSNYFIPLEAKRMVNAATEEGERKARSILGSEIGVPINVESGSIEGFAFSHKLAHITWLRDIGEMLGLDRDRLGKWSVGSPATHEFLQRLDGVYGSPDSSLGSGASFAVESWAGFGIGAATEVERNNFWKELVTGFDGFNRKHRDPHGLPPLDVSFFQFHFDLELGHVANVEDDLSDVFFAPGFDSDAWYRGGTEALDALLVFWTGLANTAGVG
jgi:hypothetical protein